MQARILVDHSPELSHVFLALIVAMKIAGYVIFRGSNSQKDQFRRDPTHPSVAHLKTLKVGHCTSLAERCRSHQRSLNTDGEP